MGPKVCQLALVTVVRDFLKVWCECGHVGVNVLSTRRVHGASDLCLDLGPDLVGAIRPDRVASTSAGQRAQSADEHERLRRLEGFEAHLVVRSRGIPLDRRYSQKGYTSDDQG